MSIRFATRVSLLARQQTSTVIQALQTSWPGLKTSEIPITTRGDNELSRPLPAIGGKGLFTQELETAILTGKVDAAVHSLKDLPTEDPLGLTIGAIPLRQDPRDVLISAEGFRLETLPEGARVGTSSPRRAAQLLAIRPDLKIENLRGNIDSRLRKAEEGAYDAIVLAAAGLIRLGRVESVSEWLTLEQMLPAPGQGALAVQCRAGDTLVRRMLAAIDDLASRRAVQAERAFLSGLGGGCAVPVAAFATVSADLSIDLHGLVASPDGSQVFRIQGTGAEPNQLGAELARQVLEQGAGKLLRQRDLFSENNEG